MKMNFYDWCIKNNYNNILEQYDYNNNPDPKYLAIKSHKKIYFICKKYGSRIGPTLLHTISDTLNRTGTYQFKCMYCSSFGKWCENNNKYNLLNCWDYNNNPKSPYELVRNSRNLIKFVCDRCGEFINEYKLTDLCSINRRNFLCNKCDSFINIALNKYGYNFLEKYWDYDKNIENPNYLLVDSSKYIWIKCINNALHSSYKILAKDFLINNSCPYCKTFKNRKTFYDWCNENNRHDILSMWNYDKNGSPNSYTYMSHKKIYLNCNKCSHENTYIISNISYSNKELVCSKCNSLETWCINNNRYDILDRWDYNLNKFKPSDITYASHKKIYLLCPNRKHKSELYRISNLEYYNTIDSLNSFSLDCRKCNSFAQFNIDRYGNDFLDKYWDYSLNNLNPWYISRCGLDIIFIKCINNKLHGSYKIQTSSFGRLNNIDCPYCNGTLLHFTNSLGYVYPTVIDIWSNKNNSTPLDYIYHNNDILLWWKCENGVHEDYQRTIGNSRGVEFRCPNCSSERAESLLQEKVRKYLINLGYNINHEYLCSIAPIHPITKRKLPYDNEIIINLKNLIIEVHGLQHYQRVKNWIYKDMNPDESLIERKWRDLYKKEYALSNGYYYLEIHYTSEINDEYKKLIDNKILEIISDKK